MLHPKPEEIMLTTFPVSTNALYQGRRFLTKRGKENKIALSWETKVAWAPRMPLEGKICLAVRFYWPNHRNHDVDNIKTLLDSFSGILYKDDGQIVELHVFKEIDKENPRVEINLSNLASLKA